MGAPEFGRMVEQAMAKKEMSQARLAVLVGVLPGGGVLNETQIRRIREGGRRLDTELVGRLIEVLDLDPMPAWEAAGLWPPGFSADDLSELRAARVEAAQRAAFEGAAASPTRRVMAAGRVAQPSEGAAASASPSVSDQQDSTTATLIASARQRVAA